MMIRTILIFAAFYAFPLITLAQETSPNDLERYRWKNRLLLIFSPSTENVDYQEQMRIFRDEEQELADRDLKVFHLLSQGESLVDGQKIAKPQVDRLARDFAVDPQSFTILLIGKDGTEKLRQNSPLKSQKLYKVIDAMPMRRQELKEEGET